MKKQGMILFAFVIVLVLLFAFKPGGEAPSVVKHTNNSDEGVSLNEIELHEQSAEIEEALRENADELTKDNVVNKSEEVFYQSDEIQKEEHETENIVSEIPKLVDTGDEKKELMCTLSVRCDTVLNNMEKLDDEKAGIIPVNGIIFEEQTVVFYEGESVFDLLVREMKKNKIHLEFENTPIYNSAYIEGIANLYEYDCGNLSGWTYKINGALSGYGCSQRQINEGDKIEWVYTCDLGKDVGVE